MRLPTASLFLIVAVLLGEMQAASAQSPTSYQWCARHFGNWMVGPMSCYFPSYHAMMDLSPTASKAVGFQPA